MDDAIIGDATEATHLPKVPMSLYESLKALEEDHVMINAFGSEFIQMYLQMKRDESARLKIILSRDEKKSGHSTQNEEIFYEQL